MPTHSLLRSAFLSLAPGVLLLVFFILLAPLAMRNNIPAVCVLFGGFALVLIPFELGYLLVQGRKLNGKLSLKGVIGFREHVRGCQFVVLVVAVLGWAGVCFFFLANDIDRILLDRFFQWIPRWFFFDDLMQHRALYSNTAIIVTMSLGLIFNGVIGPIVEELYFRGFLLPRLIHIGRWAPLLNVVLFSLYHLFSPWQNITRLVALLPMVYAVWWKRNIFIGIVTHCALNTVGMLVTILFLFRS